MLDSQLKAKLAQTTSGFPQALILGPNDITDPNVDVVPVFTKLLIKLEALQTEFFIDRLLIRKGYDAFEGLLATSFETVAITLGLWTHMDRFAKNRVDFEWLVRL